jgi:dipeptidyl aminopeptidase/acylaminoacyl peptidase
MHNLRVVPLLFLLTAVPVVAEELTYQVPDKVVAQFVDSPRNPSALVGPDRKTAVLVTPRAFPSIAEISATELRLAGIRIDPKNRSTTRRFFGQGLALLDLRASSPTSRPVTGLPADARMQDFAWSPDGRRFAFTLTGDTSITLWSLDPATAVAAPVSKAALVGTFSDPCQWLPDSRGLLCRVAPESAGTPPAASTAPKGPVVQENKGGKHPARTNPNLLTNPYDEDELDYFGTAQIELIGLDGSRQKLGAPGLYMAAVPSPDGQYLRVEALHRPFSYHVDLSRFPLRTEIWARDGNRVSSIADLPLAEDVPVDFDAVRVGRRDIQWRDDAPATICWVEARDGGDPKVAIDVHDEVLCAKAPFKEPPTSLAKLGYRFSGIRWGNGHLALVQEGWFKTRRSKTWVVAPDGPGDPRVLWDRSAEDRYTDPGSPVMRSTPSGGDVLQIGPDGSLLLVGSGASKEGDRPFLDRLDVASGKSTRLWHSEGEAYARVAEVLDDRGGNLLLWRETVTTPPQLYVAMKGKEGHLTEHQITHFPHPVPELAQVRKQLIRWKRTDGVELSGMLYTPAGFRPGVDAPLPVLVWVYPAEFKSASAASEVRGSPYQFAAPSPSGPLFALTQGYAVVDNPSFPIVGEGKTEPNDTYVSQLISDAQGMVDEVVQLKVGDRNRFAIGGHSYGAFTTANLLAHSHIFRAGIARSGAYNRTLTPFGFQSEERTYWEAPEVYMAMSPFRFATEIKAPLLMIHGAADDNPGTYTIQSDRLFEALQGLGGQVRYVSLPAEAHGYRARESLLHMLWEQTRFLDANVKNAPAPAAH